ncbi:MAG: hypothetical protein HY549_09275 [Elusimicrobia bacterium]|nr:hypothetical protein [Elusimicrobiota bacterium]
MTQKRKTRKKPDWLLAGAASAAALAAIAWGAVRLWQWGTGQPGDFERSGAVIIETEEISKGR